MTFINLVTSGDIQKNEELNLVLEKYFDCGWYRHILLV